MEIVEKESATSKTITRQLNLLIYAWMTKEGVSGRKGIRVSPQEKLNAEKSIPELTAQLSDSLRELLSVKLQKQAFIREMDGLPKADEAHLNKCREVLKGELRGMLIYSTNFEGLRKHFEESFKWLWEKPWTSYVS